MRRSSEMTQGEIERGEATDDLHGRRISVADCLTGTQAGGPKRHHSSGYLTGTSAIVAVDVSQKPFPSRFHIKTAVALTSVLRLEAKLSLLKGKCLIKTGSDRQHVSSRSTSPVRLRHGSQDPNVNLTRGPTRIAACRVQRSLKHRPSISELLLPQCSPLMR